MGSEQEKSLPPLPLPLLPLPAPHRHRLQPDSLLFLHHNLLQLTPNQHGERVLSDIQRFQPLASPPPCMEEALGPKGLGSKPQN